MCKNAVFDVTGGRVQVMMGPQRSRLVKMCMTPPPPPQAGPGRGEERSHPAVGRQQEAAEGDRGQDPGDAAVLRGKHPGGRERRSDPGLREDHVQRDQREAAGVWTPPPLPSPPDPGR